MLDVRSGRMVEQPQLVVRGGRIESVGRAGDAAPADAKRIDLAGMTLLPGLIDMHVHLIRTRPTAATPACSSATASGRCCRVAHAQKHAEGRLHHRAQRRLRALERRRPAPGHRRGQARPGRAWSRAAYAFGATGGHCDSTFFPPSMDQKSPFNADSPEEGRKSVREVRKYGAQVIKICATGGVFSRNTEPGQQQLSLEEMQAIADEAHQWGLKVAAHAHGAAGIKDAIRAGIDTIEHASLIDDEGISLAKQHGAWLSMDIYNTDYTQAEGKKNGVLEDNLRKDREVADLQRENFRKAHAAGVKMIYGTDAGVYPHGDNGKQFAVMVRYGMTPVQAIQAATLNAADALGRKDVGVIERAAGPTWSPCRAIRAGRDAAGSGALRDEGRRSGEGR